MRRHGEVCAKPVYRRATPQESLCKASIPVCDATGKFAQSWFTGLYVLEVKGRLFQIDVDAHIKAFVSLKVIRSLEDDSTSMSHFRTYAGMSDAR